MSDEDTFQLRLREVVSRVGSIAKLASRSGIGSRTISDYLNGSSEPSRERLVALAQAGGVSAGWLATGREPIRTLEEAGAYVGGEMARFAEAASEAAQGASGAHPPSDFIYVPRYDIEASAGGGAEVHSEQIVDYLAFRRDWVLSQGFEPRQLALIEALGDSMAPTIEDKDLVLVDLSHRTLGRPGVYVLRRDHTLLAKRLEVRWDGPGVIVRSVSPAYDDQTLDEGEAAQLQILGRVVWLARRL